MLTGPRLAPFFAETEPTDEIKKARFVQVTPATNKAAYSDSDGNAVSVSDSEAEYNYAISYLPVGYTNSEVLIELAETVSKGDGLSSDADGKAVKETTTADQLAQACEDGVSGDIITARLFIL